MKEERPQDPWREEAWEARCLASLQRVWAEAPTGILVTGGAEHRLLYQNQSCIDLLGVLPLGEPIQRLLPHSTALGVDRLTSVLRTGQTVRTDAHTLPMPDMHGRPIVMRYIMAPLGDPPRAVVTMGEDVTAHTLTARALKRTAFLADVTQQMITADDPTTALQRLTDCLTHGLVDMAAVYILPEGQQELRGVPLPPEVLSLGSGISALGPPPSLGQASQWDAERWRTVLRAGRPIVIPLTPEGMAGVAPEPAGRAWLTGAGMRHLAAVPLVVAGTLSAVLVVGVGADGLGARQDDLPRLEDVAARAAVAIDRIRSARQLRSVALQLQRALLPPRPPKIAGMQVAARYIAGAPNVEVGGDWWHMHDHGHGRVSAGIGDVSGRGLEAASVMGQVSAAMRAAGIAGLSPAAVLTLLDSMLDDIVAGSDRDAMSPQFATACYLALDRHDRSVIASSAGHLPILVRHSDARVERWSPSPGPPLGLGVGGYRESRYRIESGDTIVLYTDGLVESRVEPLEDGLRALTGLLQAAPTERAEGIADHLVSGMNRGHGNGLDDVALLVLRWVEEGAGTDVNPPAVALS